MQYKVHLRARHFPGKRFLIAVVLSRDQRLVSTEWEMPQEIANQVFAIWGNPMVDLFASVRNRKLPLFVAPIPDPRALAVDALAVSG